jgi:hypothetical protein
MLVHVYCCKDQNHSVDVTFHKKYVPCQQIQLSTNKDVNIAYTI